MAAPNRLERRLLRERRGTLHHHYHHHHHHHHHRHRYNPPTEPLSFASGLRALKWIRPLLRPLANNPTSRGRILPVPACSSTSHINPSSTLNLNLNIHRNQLRKASSSFNNSFNNNNFSMPPRTMVALCRETMRLNIPRHKYSKYSKYCSSTGTCRQTSSSSSSSNTCPP